MTCAEAHIAFSCKDGPGPRDQKNPCQEVPVDPRTNPKGFSSGMMAAVPVIRGTRVSLMSLIQYLNDGRGLEAFLADHPQVTPAQATRAIVTGLEALVERREEVFVPGTGQPLGSASPASPPAPDRGPKQP